MVDKKPKKREKTWALCRVVAAVSSASHDGWVRSELMKGSRIMPVRGGESFMSVHWPVMLTEMGK